MAFSVPPDLIEKIIADGEEFAKKWNDLGSGFTKKKLFAIITFSVTEVEKISSTIVGLSSDDKLNLACDIILKIIPIPSFIPDLILKPLLKLLINYVVGKINDLLGKVWLEKDVTRDVINKIADDHQDKSASWNTEKLDARSLI